MAPYFTWLESQFGHLKCEAERNKIPADTLAKAYLGDSQRRQRFQEDVVSKTIDGVLAFWRENGDTVTRLVRETPGMKGRFGGDIGPQFRDRTLERTGVYFDSVLVPDPLLRVARIPDGTTKTKDYYLLKYAIMQLQYRDAYLADVAPPIAVLVPDPELLTPDVACSAHGQVRQPAAELM